MNDQQFSKSQLQLNLASGLGGVLEDLSPTPELLGIASCENPLGLQGILGVGAQKEDPRDWKEYGRK